MVFEAGAFLVGGGLEHHFSREGQAIRYAVRIAVDSHIPKARLV